MSRLDSLIRRFTAQRATLNQAFKIIPELKGIVVELGLGSGRTFDHLRENLPGREIYAFDYKVATHPGCAPEPRYAVLGEIRETLPRFADQNEGRAVFIHSDIGSANPADDQGLVEFTMKQIDRLARDGAVVATDRMMSMPNWERLSQPPDAGDWLYALYRVTKR